MVDVAGEGVRGQVIKLDRGYPLVKLENGEVLRCEHATELVKEGQLRAVIGDNVVVAHDAVHDKAIITCILERKNVFSRKDPAERTVAQILAANFDLIIIAQPLVELNVRRLERELVLAHETGAQIVMALTKADLSADEAEIQRVVADVQERVGKNVQVIVVSAEDRVGVRQIAELIAPDKTAVLIGKSGVGKSSLVNMLVGREVQETQSVREVDGRGRHTTVAREIIELESGGRIVDMPGVRGLGMWEAEEGIGAAFADIQEYAQQCKFDDCKHIGEPGCAVLAAVAAGEISQQRLDSYLNLMQESQMQRERKEKARWASHERGRKKGR